jgi:hypothetical protein
MTTEIEKQNLESHVELCALRYAALENRLDGIESKVGRLQTTIEAGHLSTTKILIGTAGTVVASMAGVAMMILGKHI